MTDAPDNDREIAERIRAAAAAVRAAVRPDTARADHPAPDRLVAYVDGTLDEIEIEVIDAHLALCSTCREDVADLRLVATPSAPRSGRVPGWLIYAGTGLAAAAVLAAVMVWSRGGLVPPSPSPAVARQTAPAAAAPLVLSLADGDHTATLDADGRLAGVPVLAPAERDALVAALRTSRVDVPDAIAALRGRADVSLGPRSGPVLFRPVGPVGTAVDSRQPVFTWTGLRGAVSYVVSVFDADLKTIAESGPLTTLTWTPPSALRRGQTYTWQIRARAAGENVIAPRPPAAEARFRVLSDAEAESVAALRRTAAGSPLTRGVLLARAGLVDEAARDLERVVADNPSSPEARRLLESIRGQ